jgi:alpha-beta hydrolase superfamily lysophospholipase
LVHCFVAILLHVRRQYDDLVAAGYTVYRLELLGFGASEKSQDVKRDCLASSYSRDN